MKNMVRMWNSITIGISPLAAIIVLSALSLAGCKTDEVSTKHDVINIAAIEGVTVPATGQAPVTEITETSQYTGTVTWKTTAGDDFTGNFEASKSYTATITLKPKNGFTLDGVSEDFFTVEGTSTPAANSANSGVITAVFPATAGTNNKPTVINLAAIPSVTAPASGATPRRTISTSQYTGNIAWRNAEGAILTGNFAALTVYTAIISLTPEDGYTLEGVAANFFTVAGATSVISNEADSGVISAVFPATGQPIVINIAAIQGVNAPTTGATPARTITETAQYTGRVTWNDDPTTFAVSTVYTATIILTPKNGYTLTGVAANFFTVAGTSTPAVNSANSGSITAVFPRTPTIITISDISGVTIPVAGATPVTTITETAQYTGRVTWNGNPATFAALVTYTATITLTAKSGYTLAGVGANFFTVAGTSAPAANSANSGVITAVFPRTIGTASNPVRVDIKNIELTVQPAAGAAQDTVAVIETLQYTGFITWSPSDYVFSSTKLYDATITLTAKTGCTFTGVTANFFTVSGKLAANPAIPVVMPPGPYPNPDNINIKTTFNVSVSKVDPTIPIRGVKVPKKDVQPDLGITFSDQYTGKVDWYVKNTAFTGSTFGDGVEYTAKITLTAKEGFTFTGVATDSFIVDKADVGNTAKSVSNPPGAGNTIVITVVYFETASTTIPSDSITNKTVIPGVQAPKAGEMPSSITQSVNNQNPSNPYFTAEITWAYPTSPFTAEAVYNARITVTPKTGYTLTGVKTNQFSVNITGAKCTNDAGSGIVTVTFPITESYANRRIPVRGASAPITALPFAGMGFGADDYTCEISSVVWTASTTSTNRGYFEADTIYTATITLTAKTGYTLYGIGTSDFVVDGATPPTNFTYNTTTKVGTVRITFPKTGPATKINSAVIDGITAPEIGETPAATITGTDQYTGTVTWQGALNSGKFKAGVQYTANIILTAKPGFTFQGVTANSFSLQDITTPTVTVTNPGVTSNTIPSTVTVTARFAVLNS